jgi:soluble P-type ATPase
VRGVNRIGMVVMLRNSKAAGLAQVYEGPWSRAVPTIARVLSELSEVVHELRSDGIDIYFACADIGGMWWRDVTGAPDITVTCAWCVAGLRRTGHERP